MAAPIRSDFCTFDREFGTILEIGHLQPEFDLDGLGMGMGLLRVLGVVHLTP